jgi:hypothetical protein
MQGRLPDLPLLPREVKDEIFDSTTHRTRTSYYVKEDSASLTFMSGHEFLLHLYHIGTTLINAGLAYTHHVPKLIEVGYGLDFLNLPKERLEANRHVYLDFYYNLPECTILENG